MFNDNQKSYRLLPVNFLYQDDRPVPVIHLQGNWLQKFGFLPGGTLLVERQPGCLIIRPLSGENALDGTTAAEDIIANLATKEDIENMNAKTDTLNTRLFRQEAELAKLIAAK